jgi:hypothetical protein
MTGHTGIGEDIEQEPAIDAEQAALIVQQTRTRAHRELEVRYPLLYLAYGLTVLIVYGALWLSVRTQHPYHGLSKVGSGVWLVVLAVAFFGFVIRAGVIGRAVTGVGGRIPRQWAIFVASLGAGSAALWIETAALTHAGASRPVVGVLIAAAPMLAAGFAFLVSSAIRADWPTVGLGVWLLALAAGATWAGPVTILEIYALAGGGGFLAMAGVEALVRR